MIPLPIDTIPGDALSTAASGMSTQRIRMNVLANNLANINTTRDAKGEFLPYLRKEVIFKTTKLKLDQQGVKVSHIAASQRPLRRIYDPGHPEADSRGYRMEPNVSIAHEMVNMIEASRAYEANLNAMKTAGRALKKTTDILGPPPSGA